MSIVSENAPALNKKNNNKDRLSKYIKKKYSFEQDLAIEGFLCISNAV